MVRKSLHNKSNIAHALDRSNCELVLDLAPPASRNHFGKVLGKAWEGSFFFSKRALVFLSDFARRRLFITEIR